MESPWQTEQIQTLEMSLGMSLITAGFKDSKFSGWWGDLGTVGLFVRVML